jgi:uncharacterized repeat protein (TIGR04076 family)
MSDDTPARKPFNWEKFQQNLGYTDEQMAEFKADPRRRRAAEVLPEANRKTIVATVVASHGCAAGFKEGDTIEVSAAGLVKSCNVCIYAVAPMTIHAAMAHDRIAAGLDPNEMWFNHFSCQDAGFCNGSWGQVSFKVEVK